MSSVEIELQEIPSRSRGDGDKNREEDVEEAEDATSTSNSDYNNDDNDDEHEEDEENPREEQDTYAEGDVVEIDPEEKALLPCFGRGLWSSSWSIFFRIRID